MDIATAAPAAQDETITLTALKPLINDATRPTLDQVRALKAHRDVYSQPLKVLLGKLGVLHKRSYFSLALGLLPLGDEALQPYEGRVLSFREMRRILGPVNTVNTQDKGDTTPVNTEGTAVNTRKHSEPTVNTPVNTPKNSVNTVNTPVNRPKSAVNSVNTGVNTDNPANARSTRSKPAQPSSGAPGLAETIEESFLWQGLYSMPVVWRMIPWLRGQVHGMKGSPEKRRVWIGWGLTALALWFFFPKIWPAVNRWRNGGSSAGPASSTSGSAGQVGQSGGQSVPVLQVTNPVFGAGHRIELHWKDLGPGYRYHVYYTCSNDPSQMAPIIGDPTVSTPGALVDLSYGGCRDGGYLAALVEAPNHNLGDLSAPIRFDHLNPANQSYSLQPLPPVGQSVGEGAASPATANAGHANLHKENQLPHSAPSAPISAVPVANPQQVPHAQSSFLGSFAKKLVGGADGVVSSMVPIVPLAQGINATKNAALQASAETNAVTPAKAVPNGGQSRQILHEVRDGVQPQTSPVTSTAVPVPTGLQVVKMLSPSQAQISWTSLGSNYTYNLYSSRTQDMANAHKENAQPTAKTVVSWWSDFGPGTYWLAVTAIDPSGNESQFYNSVQVTVQ